MQDDATENPTAPRRLALLGLASGLGALGLASCCALPLILMSAGAGSAVIGAVAGATAFAYPMIGLAALLLAAGWVVVIRRQAPARLHWYLGGGTVVSVVALMVVVNEAAINDWLIGIL